MKKMYALKYGTACVLICKWRNMLSRAVFFFFLCCDRLELYGTVCWCDALALALSTHPTEPVLYERTMFILQFHTRCRD